MKSGNEEEYRKGGETEVKTEESKAEEETADHVKPLSDGLKFTCDKAFFVFSSLFLVNLYICLRFPQSVKVSTQYTATFC